MNETLRLGNLAGVRVGVNWSVLVIVALLMVGLAAGRFPLLYPGHTQLTYAIAGAVAAVAFLTSLLAHELAHAVVARSSRPRPGSGPAPDTGSPGARDSDGRGPTVKRRQSERRRHLTLEVGRVALR